MRKFTGRWVIFMFCIGVIFRPVCAVDIYSEGRQWITAKTRFQRTACHAVRFTAELSSQRATCMKFSDSVVVECRRPRSPDAMATNHPCRFFRSFVAKVGPMSKSTNRGIISL